MYVAHHARAVDTGARLVHACGFDSIPHDLGAQFAVEQLPEGVPLTVRGYVRAGGRFSGGTFASALTGFSRPRQNMAAAAPQGTPSRARPTAQRQARRRAARTAPAATGRSRCRRSTRRSSAARPARCERYGPDFSYGHYAAVKRLPIAVGGVAGVATLVAAAQVGPAAPRAAGAVARRATARPTRRWTPAGSRSRSSARAAAGAWSARSAAATPATARPRACSPTRRSASPSTTCPRTAGQVTTAQALGPALRARLDRVGDRVHGPGGD